MGKGCEFLHSRKTQRVVMAVGLSGPGPNSQNQEHWPCRQFSQNGFCNFGDACKIPHDASISQEKPHNANSRGPTRKTTPKGNPRGTPHGGTPKGSKKYMRHKSPKLSAVAEVVEIDAESSEESSSSSEAGATESESNDSLSISLDEQSSSSSE